VTDESDFAWACGLFEGEGSITNHADENSRRNLRRLQLGTTDLDVLERFQTIMGGTILKKPNKGVNRPIWRWQLTHWDDVEPLLRRMLPYLGIRRRAAAEALLANPPSRRSPGGWKPGEACARCGTTDRPHGSVGLCGSCYTAMRRSGIC
jgi:hypothetical protein